MNEPELIYRAPRLFRLFAETSQSVSPHQLHGDKAKVSFWKCIKQETTTEEQRDENRAAHEVMSEERGQQTALFR